MVPHKLSLTITAVAIGMIMVAAALIVALPRNDAAAAPGEQVSLEDVITVSGIGTIQAEPDIAYLNIGVETVNEDVNAAVEEANANIDSVTQTLIEMGIDENDIQTNAYNIFQEGPVGPSMPTESGMVDVVRNYRVFIMLSVVVRDIDTVGEVLSAAINAGANNVNSINFGIEDRSALEAEARALALANARERADHIAGELQVSIVAPVRVEAYGDSAVAPIAEAAYGRGGGGGAPISTGSLMINVQVNVTYSFVGNP